MNIFMKPHINKDLCMGCGTCTSICPEIFRIGEDGKSEVIEGVDYGAHAEKIKEAMESCPTKAILA